MAGNTLRQGNTLTAFLALLSRHEPIKRQYFYTWRLSDDGEASRAPAHIFQHVILLSKGQSPEQLSASDTLQHRGEIDPFVSVFHPFKDLSPLS